MASVATDSSGVEPMVPMVPEHAAAPSHEELLGAVLEQMEALTWTVASMDSRLQAVVRARGQHRCVGARRARALTLVLRACGRDRRSASALWRNGVSRQPASPHLICRTSGRRHSFNPSSPPEQTTRCPTGSPQRLPLWASQILVWPNQSRRDRPTDRPSGQQEDRIRHRTAAKMSSFSFAVCSSVSHSFCHSGSVPACLPACLSHCSLLFCLSDAYYPPSDMAQSKMMRGQRPMTSLCWCDQWCASLSASLSCSLCLTLVPEGFALSYPFFVDTYAVCCA